MNLLLVVYKKIELSVGFLHVLTHSLHITITCLFFFSLSPDHKQTKTKRKEKKEKRKENSHHTRKSVN